MVSIDVVFILSTSLKITLFFFFFNFPGASELLASEAYSTAYIVLLSAKRKQIHWSLI